MLSKIWLFLILISLTYGIFRDVVGVNSVILNVSYNSLDMFFQIACGLILWSGILEVAKTTNFLNFCTKKINVLTKRLFNTKDEKIISLISANCICNFLGLTTMATPFGLEAVTELKKENTKTDIEILLIINYVGASLLPLGLLTLRSTLNSNYTVELIPYIITIGIINTVLGIFIIKVFRCFI